MKKWLFNPFIYIAGTRSLIIGLAIMIVTACVCFFSHTHFNGLLQEQFHAAPVWSYFLDAFIDWSIPVIIFYAAGSIFSKSSIRFIDVAGTFAMARWVMIFVAFTGFGIHMADVETTSIDEVVKSITPTAVLLMFLGLICMAWMIALMYNAFVISCNIKRGNAAGIFIVCLLITEILSRTILYFSHHL